MYNVLDPIAKQNLAVGAASVASSAFNACTKEVMLTASVACWFRIDPTSVAAVAAAAGTVYLPANTAIRITAKPGYILNVIQASTGGYLSILEGL